MQTNIQKEAVGIIRNLVANCNKQQVDYFINKGIIEPVCARLFIEDNELILIVLECLNIMLKISSPDVEALTDLIEECGGIFYLFSSSFLFNYKTKNRIFYE